MSSAAAPAPEGKLRPEHILIIALGAFCYLLDGLTHSILGPLAPAMARDLGLSRAELGPVFSANLVGQIVGLTLVPMLQGRLGHRRLIIACTVVFGLLEAATAFAGSRDQIIVLRFLTGVGLGGALPSCLALIAESTPARRRGVAVMTLFVGYGSGAVFAGVLANAFSGDGGWRTALIVGGVLSLVCAAVNWRWLAESPSYLANRNRPAEAPRLKSEDALWRLFTPDMLLGTLMLWVIFVSALIVNYCLSSWLPTLLVDIGRSHSAATFSVSAFAIGGVTANILVGPLIDRFGSFRILTAFFALAAVFLFAAGRAMIGGSEPMLLALIAAAGFFLLGAYGGVNVVLAEFYPAQLRAIGAGWSKSVGRIGTVLAPILIGFALTWGAREQDVMSMFAVPAMVAAIAMVIVGASRTRRLRRTAEPAPEPV
jgi:MFS transporter, AAHS family, 4-hydroxybenzoate transporter